LLTPSQRKKALAELTNNFDPQEVQALEYLWAFWARKEQLPPPGDWAIWLMLAGRGWGKTRALCEWVRSVAESGKYRRIALVGRTSADVRDVLIEGESGILSISHPEFVPEWNAGKRRLSWPNGVIATTYSAENPSQLRGPQHDAAACDELASWRYPEAWDNLMFGLRLGERPLCVVATTPRPVPLIKDLVADPATVVTTGTTYENRAHLAPSFFTQIIRKYEGTRLGLQEIYAQVLSDNPRALWKRDLILHERQCPDLVRIVVGVDPQAGQADGSSETGIIVAGLDVAGRGWVLEDCTITGSPLEWATAAITAYYKYRADRIVVETNQGGDMVAAVIRSVDSKVPIRGVYASRGKQARAEPVAALYEQGRVRHLGVLAALEDQMCEWVPGEGASPDRVDALVWALFDLMLRSGLRVDQSNAVGVDKDYLARQEEYRGPIRAELDTETRLLL